MIPRQLRQGKVPASQRRLGPARLGQVLERGALGELAAHAQVLQRLDASLGEWLDEPLKAHCRVANLSANRLVLQVDSPAWSQRMRFALPGLARHLESLAASALPAHRGGLEVVVRVARSTRPERPRGPRPIRQPVSARSARLIDSVADELPTGPTRTALKRIAARAGRRLSAGSGPE